MTQLNFNINLEELTGAVLKSDLNHTMKSIAVLVFNAYMEAERDGYMRVGKYERNDGRQDYRNGYYERDYTLSIGKIALKVPRTRSGEFSTTLFERYKRMDQAFVLTMAEAVVNGVSTRKVTKIIEQLCGESVSKSFVSDAMKHLDPKIKDFKNRSLTKHYYRYVYVDAMYIDVRENHRIVKKAVYIAQGVNELNKREILGFKVSDQESEVAWQSFFKELRERGLRTPKMIISDAHKGLKKAIGTEFVGTTWQRCTVHLLRNIITKMPKKDSVNERKLLRKIFRARTLQEAKERREGFENLVKDNHRYDDALEILDSGFLEGLQYLNEPEAYHLNLRTTNSLERINREVRRRERVVSIFPNKQSAERLIGAVLLDIHTHWKESNQKYLKDTFDSFDPATS